MVQFYQAIKDSGLLSDEDYKAVLALQSEIRNSTFYNAIQRSELMDSEQLVSFACEFFGMSRIGDAFSAQLDYPGTMTAMGSIQNAISAKMFSLIVGGKRYFIVNDPENESLRTKVVAALGVEPVWALVTDVEYEVILQYQLTPRAISDQANSIKTSVTSAADSDELGAMASYTDKLLSMLITAAMDRRASDLHLMPLDAERAKVMLRVDGKLYHYTDIKADILMNLRNKLKTMSGVGGETPDAPVEGQIAFQYKKNRIDIRINILKTVIGYDFNMRFIDSSLRGLEELGLSESNYNQYVDLLHMTKGMVILCGPTGSGKTTLLYAGFKKLLSENKAIFTIEDPVEIILPGTTQVNVKKERGMSYGERFPSSLRHDPDIIAIGETRTLEVAEQAVQAANTGHLVFTTLHTNDAVGAISRLTNLGLAPYAIGDVLAAVVAQRLVRRVCPNCKEEYDLPEDHPWRKRFALGDGRIKLARGCGCEYCAGSGYRGRIGVNEFMICTPELRDAIQKNKTRKELEDVLASQGYKTYLEDAKEKALEGLTTFDEVDELYRDILGTHFNPESSS